MLFRLYNKTLFHNSCTIKFLPAITYRLLSTTPDVETVDLAYDTYGSTTDDDSSSRPPLVILPGLLGSRKSWKGLSTVILKTTGRKVITVDARNHGDSQYSSQHSYIHMAHDVKQLMKKLEVSKISILGQSMGGHTAMVLSLLFPDLVSSLIVLDMSPFKTSSFMITNAGLFDAMTAISIKSGTAMSEARKVADEQLKPVTPNDNQRKYMIKNLIQTNTGSYKWNVNIPVLKDNFQSELARFPSSLKGLQYSGPTLFVAGSLSDYIGKDDLKNIREYFPLAEISPIEGAGHWVVSEQPEKFIKAVCKFLEEK